MILIGVFLCLILPTSAENVEQIIDWSSSVMSGTVYYDETTGTVFPDSYSFNKPLSRRNNDLFGDISGVRGRYALKLDVNFTVSLDRSFDSLTMVINTKEIGTGAILAAHAYSASIGSNPVPSDQFLLTVEPGEPNNIVCQLSFNGLPDWLSSVNQCSLSFAFIVDTPPGVGELFRLSFLESYITYTSSIQTSVSGAINDSCVKSDPDLSAAGDSLDAQENILKDVLGTLPEVPNFDSVVLDFNSWIDSMRQNLDSFSAFLMQLYSSFFAGNWLNSFLFSAFTVLGFGVVFSIFGKLSPLGNSIARSREKRERDRSAAR